MKISAALRYDSRARPVSGQTSAGAAQPGARRPVRNTGPRMRPASSHPSRSDVPFAAGVIPQVLSLHLPVYAVAAGAFVAGAGSAIFGTYLSTVMQQRVPQEMLARATAFDLTGAYALGSVGFAVIGQVAAVVGAGPLLRFGAAYVALSSTAVLALRAIRSVR